MKRGRVTRMKGAEANGSDADGNGDGDGDGADEGDGPRVGASAPGANRDDSMRL